MAIRLPRALLHPLCLIGLVVAGSGFAASTVALVADINSHDRRPYQGLLTFLLYPGITAAGLGLVALGLWMERRRRRRFEERELEWYPAIDLTRPAHRAGLTLLAIGMLAFVVLSITGSYRAYEFTESPSFCGAMCHSAMNPQYVAHQNSPHANVACAHCHVGPGMDDYFSAKVSGLRQVYQVLTDGFHRPIHASSERIPRAAETCIHCHWPDQEWGTLLDSRVRYGYDLQSSRRSLQVLPKVGGGETTEAGQGGIHAHANILNRVWFRTSSERPRVIPWVKVERPDGTVVVYEDNTSSLDAVAVAALPERQMDCLDCHNRPAHRFLSPDEALDQALESGAVDRSLPFIKKVSVQALAGHFETQEAAREGIRGSVESFYTENFNGEVLRRKQSLEASIASLQDIYDRNVFPEVGVDWNTYPSHVGHRSSPGCFSCHDGKHVTKQGDALESRCDLCHTFVRRERGSSTMIEVAADASFVHPFRSEVHASVACWTCHTGSASPYAGCTSCHTNTSNGHSMRFECSICHKPKAEGVSRTSCAACHPAAESPMHVLPAHADCTGCHQQHDWKVDQQSCLGCHAALAETACPGPTTDASCTSCHEFRGMKMLMGGLPVHR